MPPSAGNKPSFQQLQYAFTRHIRDPEKVPAPTGIEDRRLGIYRDLLYNNVEQFMANSFPVLRKITPDEKWHAMIREYFKHHQAHTPLFPKMPSEFLQYLENERGDHEDDFPFLYELAHYEWVEVALMLDPREISTDGVDPEGDLLEGRPVLSELAWPLSYRYPVHRIKPDYLPDTPAEIPSYLVVYRSRDDKVGFMELNPVSARLLECLQQGSAESGREILQRIAKELQHPNPQIVINGGTQILQLMHQHDIITGIKSPR